MNLRRQPIQIAEVPMPPAPRLMPAAPDVRQKSETAAAAAQLIHDYDAQVAGLKSDNDALNAEVKALTTERDRFAAELTVVKKEHRDAMDELVENFAEKLAAQAREHANGIAVATREFQAHTRDLIAARDRSNKKLVSVKSISTAVATAMCTAMEQLNADDESPDDAPATAADEQKVDMAALAETIERDMETSK